MLRESQCNSFGSSNYISIELEEDYSEQYDPCENVRNGFYQEMFPHIVKERKHINDIKYQIYFKNGNKYTGDVIDSMLNGEGIFVWSNGTVYDGMFEKNFPEGYGRLTNSNGEIYEGFFKHGAKNGVGKYRGANFVYYGDYKNGKFHGQGRYMSPGFCCEGEFRENKLIHGIARYPNGKFIGKYDENENRQFGKFYFDKTDDIYSGSWFNDLYDGFGEYKWSTPVDKNPLIKYQEEYYIGYWSQGLQNGIGLIKFQGIQVMCNWKMGKKHGPGFVIAANGDIFVSDKLFLNNQYHECWQLIPLIFQYDLELKNKIKKLLEVVEDELNDDNSEDDLDFILDLSKNRHFAFEKGQYSFEKMPSCVEIFNNAITSLMEYRILSIKSDIYPVFILDFNLTSNLRYFYNIQQIFKLNLNENLIQFISFEMKCLNHAIKTNYNELRNIYLIYISKFGTYNPLYENCVCMPRLGLWFFYWDVLKYFPKINAAKTIAEAELYNRIFVKDPNSAIESVTFWEFLRHILHIIIEMSTNNITVAHSLYGNYSENFGYLATMLLSFLREMKSIQYFTDSKIMKLYEINEAQSVILKFFEITSSLNEEKLTLRSIYNFLQKYRTNLGFLKNINDDAFFRLSQEIFPRLMIDNTVQDTSFQVTPLEFWEVILECFEGDIKHEKAFMLMLSGRMSRMSADKKNRPSKPLNP